MLSLANRSVTNVAVMDTSHENVPAKEKGKEKGKDQREKANPKEKERTKERDPRTWYVGLARR